MFFASDNGLGASDKVMQAILAANGGARLGYGNDDATKAVERRLADLFEREVAVFMVATGTNTATSRSKRSRCSWWPPARRRTALPSPP